MRCAVKVADQLRDYLEHCSAHDVVNVPDVSFARKEKYGLTIVNADLTDMWASMLRAMGRRGIHAHNILNISKGDTADTLVYVDNPVLKETVAQLCASDGVLAVRYLRA